MYTRGKLTAYISKIIIEFIHMHKYKYSIRPEYEIIGSDQHSVRALRVPKLLK